MATTDAALLVFTARVLYCVVLCFCLVLCFIVRVLCFIVRCAIASWGGSGEAGEGGGAGPQIR